MEKSPLFSPNSFAENDFSPSSFATEQERFALKIGLCKWDVKATDRCKNRDTKSLIVVVVCLLLVPADIWPDSSMHYEDPSSFLPLLKDSCCAEKIPKFKISRAMGECIFMEKFGIFVSSFFRLLQP